MLAVSQNLPSGAKLILQVHDSMIIECDEKEADTVTDILKTSMENVAPELSVRLAVDVATGHDWGEL